jgi:hypothetical protein
MIAEPVQLPELVSPRRKVDALSAACVGAPSTSALGSRSGEAPALARTAQRANAGPHARSLAATAQRAAACPGAEGVVQRCPWCGGKCGCAEKGRASASAPPVQRAACGNERVEWYTGARGAAAGRLAAGTGGMDIAPDLAHILCCSFCRAMIQTRVYGGERVGAGGLARYTALFENLVHRYHAQTAVVGGGNRSVHTEEAYWIPANPANFAALTGLAPANAHLIDQAFWNAVDGALNGPFNVAAPGVYPAGLPVGEQAGFDAHRNLSAPVAVAPAGAMRRSYATAAIRGSGMYDTLRWVSLAAGGGGGTAWDTVRDLAGRMRVLDFAGERVPPGGGAARHTVADAKFSYAGGRFDDWGPGQAADQQTIYQEVSGGGPATSVPVVTWDRCGCNQLQAEQMAYEKQSADITASLGKRKEADRKETAAKRYKETVSGLKRIDSATVRWVR